MAHVKQKCDFCDAVAIYDGKTVYGPWAFMCERHFNSVGVKTQGLYNRIVPIVIERKICSICGQEKPISEYYQYTDHSGNTRYRTECKACNLEAKKKRRFKK